MSTLSAESNLESGSAVGSLARRAPRISREDVFAAADTLLLQGDRPTIDRVRMTLGRGSPNTINDHLDAWWAKLGSRLRDLPGQEFPQLPEAVAHSLQQLWMQALEGAQAVLRESLGQREDGLIQHADALTEQARALEERERAVNARAAAVEEGLGLAREQLIATNQRAQMLEERLRAYDEDTRRVRRESERWQSRATAALARIDTEATAHAAERARLQSHATATETRWLKEVDVARQQLKEKTQAHERQVTEQRRRTESLQSECERLRQELQTWRAQAKASTPGRPAAKNRPGTPRAVRRAKSGSRVTGSGRSGGAANRALGSRRRPL